MLHHCYWQQCVIFTFTESSTFFQLILRTPLQIHFYQGISEKCFMKKLVNLECFRLSVIPLIDETCSLCEHPILYLVYLMRYSGYINSLTSQLSNFKVKLIIQWYFAIYQLHVTILCLNSKLLPIPLSRFNFKLYVSKFQFQSLTEIYTQTWRREGVLNNLTVSKREELHLTA